MRGALITDFDGTMTEHDFYQLALARFLPAGSEEIWTEYMAHRITHFEALRIMFTKIRASRNEVLRTVSDMHIDAQAAHTVKRLTEHDFGVFIASAGCGWYIDILLQSVGLQSTTTPPWEAVKSTTTVTLLANFGRFVEGEGLLMEPPVASPFFHPNTGTDKAGVVRAALDRNLVVAFAGDGPPDVESVMLVPPQRRFAKGWLADHLRREQIPFRPFTVWSEVGEQLLRDEG